MDNFSTQSSKFNQQKALRREKFSKKKKNVGNEI